MPELPTEPMTQLVEGMAALHEMMTSAIEAGFSEEQAFTMVLHILQETMRGSQ